MINILFYAKNIQNPSYLFYSQLMNEMNGGSKGKISFTTNIEGCYHKKTTVVLFMGAEFDPAIAAKIKQHKPNTLIGIIDPRPFHCKTIKNFDFIIANGLESRDFYYKFSPNVFVYYTYPVISHKRATKKSNSEIIIGYHGNKIHLESMIPRITDAINTLAKQHRITFKCVYNIKKLGHCNKINKALNCNVEHIQYHDRAHEELRDCHIGLVPQLIPVQRRFLTNVIATTILCRFNEESDDYFLRFKSTTNIGRALVFAQLGVPVIVDFTPSATDLIQYGVNGYYAHHTESWLEAMRKLSNNKKQKEIADNFYQNFKENYAPAPQNQKFFHFLGDMI